MVVTMESQWETTIALSNGTIDDPYNLPFPQNGVPNALHRSNFAVRAATWQLSTEDIDMISFAYERCHLLPNYRTLAIVVIIITIDCLWYVVRTMYEARSNSSRPDLVLIRIKLK